MVTSKRDVLICWLGAINSVGGASGVKTRAKTRAKPRAKMQLHKTLVTSRPQHTPLAQLQGSTAVCGAGDLAGPLGRVPRGAISEAAAHFGCHRNTVHKLWRVRDIIAVQQRSPRAFTEGGAQGQDRGGSSGQSDHAAWPRSFDGYPAHPVLSALNRAKRAQASHRCANAAAHA
ncbi:hypothetical protein PR002_g2124 [Phytophthora rubi]|uniref:Uncharacterized protein n=1 Tax=Phytophthora rubi TaxID=129364 RepID=A0A6A3NSP3_9STRA|nr:hypothetical protein PR002_g2124 [Phytophthora rubi]